MEQIRIYFRSFVDADRIQEILDEIENLISDEFGSEIVSVERTTPKGDE